LNTANKLTMLRVCMIPLFLVLLTGSFHFTFPSRWRSLFACVKDFVEVTLPAL
jgi:phosphatidylglycerophosphate synthase